MKDGRWGNQPDEHFDPTRFSTSALEILLDLRKNHNVLALLLDDLLE